MNPTTEASPEQIAQVLEVIDRYSPLPLGPTVQQIAEETCLSIEAVLNARTALDAQGIPIGGSIPKDSNQSPLAVRFAHLRRL
jgi:hypothetical protein